MTPRDVEDPHQKVTGALPAMLEYDARNEKIVPEVHVRNRVHFRPVGDLIPSLTLFNDRARFSTVVPDPHPTPTPGNKMEGCEWIIYKGGEKHGNVFAGLTVSVPVNL